MQNLQALLKRLIHSPVEFVLVGGFAAVIHGCNQSTRDIDICVVNDPEQYELLRQHLKSIHPRLRTQKSKPPLSDQPMDLSKKPDLHLVTDLGVLDVIGHVKGVGDYHDVLKNSDEIELFGGKCRIISLDDLIKTKKALGRHRDLVTVMELEAIRREKVKA